MNADENVKAEFADTQSDSRIPDKLMIRVSPWPSPLSCFTIVTSVDETRTLESLNFTLTGKLLKGGKCSVVKKNECLMAAAPGLPVLLQRASVFRVTSVPFIS